MQHEGRVRTRLRYVRRVMASGLSLDDDPFLDSTGFSINPVRFCIERGIDWSNAEVMAQKT